MSSNCEFNKIFLCEIFNENFAKVILHFLLSIFLCQINEKVKEVDPFSSKVAENFSDFTEN